MAMTKQFKKTQWNNDREPAITAEQLNRMENGIDANDTRIVELDKAVTENKAAGDKSLAEVNKTLQKHTEDITAVNTELTSQGKAIGELADKKITKFYASSQGDSTLSDSDDGKMQDMMLYGKSEQKQYSGKNLLNAALQTQTVNGVACTANGDGTFTLSGMATANAYFDVSTFTFSKGVNYKLTGCPKGGDMDTKYGLYVDQIWKKDNGQGVAFSVDETLEEKIIIVVVSGNSINNLVFKPMLVNADTYPSVTYDDFEPYVGGIPSPNPDYPQEIKSVVEPVVKVTGKNLLNATLQTATHNGVTCTNNGDGTYTLNGTATANVILILTTNVARYFGTNNSLKLIGLTKTGSSTTFDFRCYIENTGTFLDYGSGTIIPNPKNNYNNIAVVVKKGSKLDNLVLKPMLVADLNATIDDFEPYHEQSVSLSGITLNAIPVSSGGNVTIDGQQYVADYVDVERGKIVRMVNNARLLSSYNWYTGDKYYFGSVTGATNSKEPVVADNSKKLCLCNYFVALPLYDIYNNVKKGIAINNPKQVAIGLEEFASADDLKTFLANNDVRLVYPLATPTEESLSNELAEKLKALQTYYPQTNLFITSNQLDGYAIFNYPISLANGWNYVKQQIGDTRDYIYDMDLQMAQAYVNSEYAVALTELEV